MIEMGFYELFVIVVGRNARISEAERVALTEKVPGVGAYDLTIESRIHTMSQKLDDSLLIDHESEEEEEEEEEFSSLEGGSSARLLQTLSPKELLGCQFFQISFQIDHLLLFCLVDVNRYKKLCLSSRSLPMSSAAIMMKDGGIVGK